MVSAWISVLDAAVAVLLVLAGLLLAHFALAAPFVGFQLFVLGMLLGLVALIAGVIGMRSARTRPAARGRAQLGTAVGGLLTVLFVVLLVSGRGYPPINDITTDLDNPPEFANAGQLAANSGRDLKYDKARYAEVQKKAYPDLTGLTLDRQPTQVFQEIRSLVATMPGWRINATDEDQRKLEAVASTSLFRFQDDVVIEVRNVEGKSRVEMRSKSRDGVGDIGANYKRIRGFFARLEPDSLEH